MDGFDKLKETLLESARGEAEAILASATAAVAVIGKQNADKIWLLKERAAKEQEALEEANQRRDAALNTLESRRTDLNARQELLDEVLRETLKELVALPDARKKAYYEKLLKSSASPETTVVCAEADLALVKEVLQSASLDLAVETDAKITGGLIFKTDRVWEDLSYESTLRTRRDEYIEIAADILFKKGEQA